MGIKFDGTADQYNITNSTDTSLSADDWCYGMWLKMDDTSGSSLRTIMSSTNISPSANDIYWGYYEDSHGSFQNQLNIRHRDTFSNPFSNNDNIRLSFASNNKWRLVVCNQIGSTGTVWFAEVGGTATQQRSTTRNLDVTTLDTNMRIGNDPGLGDPYYNNYMAEFFWMKNVGITIEEVTAMAAGMSILDLGYNPEVYIPMTEDAATLKDLAGTNHMVRGGNNQTTSDHPLKLPMQPIYVGAAEAAGGPPLPTRRGMNGGMNQLTGAMQ